MFCIVGILIFIYCTYTFGAKRVRFLPIDKTRMQNCREERKAPFKRARKGGQERKDKMKSATSIEINRVDGGEKRHYILCFACTLNRKIKSAKSIGKLYFAYVPKWYTDAWN